MSRRPKRLLVPFFVLIALVLLPALATARPHPREAVYVAAVHPDVGSSFLAQLETGAEAALVELSTALRSSTLARLRA